MSTPSSSPSFRFYVYSILILACFSQIMGNKSKQLDIAAAASNGTAGGGAAPSKLSRIKLTDKEKERLKEMIKKADSLQEIIRLEKMLTEGTIPAGVHLDGDATMED